MSYSIRGKIPATLTSEHDIYIPFGHLFVLWFGCVRSIYYGGCWHSGCRRAIPQEHSLASADGRSNKVPFSFLPLQRRKTFFFDKFRGGKLNLRRSVYKRPSYCIPFLSFPCLGRVIGGGVITAHLANSTAGLFDLVRSLLSPVSWAQPEELTGDVAAR